MKRWNLVIAILLPSILWAQTIDQIKKLKTTSQTPQATQGTTTSTPPPPSQTSPTEPKAAPRVTSQSGEILAPNNQQFNFLLSPQFQKFTQFISNKKVVAGLNSFSDKKKIKTMAIAQAILILITLTLRAWVGSKTNTFLARISASLWITGLYLFLALMVLPNFIYGPAYFDFVKEAYAFSRDIIG